MFDVPRMKQRVREWALTVENPTRKKAQKALPDIPVKVIRQVLQSLKDTT